MRFFTIIALAALSISPTAYAQGQESPCTGDSMATMTCPHDHDPPLTLECVTSPGARHIISDPTSEYPLGGTLNIDHGGQGHYDDYGYIYVGAVNCKIVADVPHG